MKKGRVQIVITSLEYSLSNMDNYQYPGDSYEAKEKRKEPVYEALNYFRKLKKAK